MRAVEPGDGPGLLELARRNREHFGRWEPPRDPEHYTLAGQEARLQSDLRDARSGRGFAYAIVGPDDRLVGRVALAVDHPDGRGPAHLGYAVDHEHTGRGYATAAVHAAVGLAFGPLGLPALQATVAPTNRGSRRVLEKAGFVLGPAQRYLYTGGGWRPHQVYVLAASGGDVTRARA